MLSRSLPDEMPGMLGIDPYRAAAPSVAGVKSARGRAGARALTILHRVEVVPRRRRHEPNAENASIVGVAETVNAPLPVVALCLEPAAECRIRKRISSMRPGDVGVYLYEVVGINGVGGLRKRHMQRRGGFASGPENARTNAGKKFKANP